MKETQQVTKCSNNKGFSGNSNILPRIKFRVGGQESSPQSLTAATLDRYQQGEEKDSNNVMTEKNGLRMKNEMKMKEKRFSFFANPQERKAESRPTFGTLPFARHTSHRFAKVKEPNLADTQMNAIKQNNSNFTVCLTN